MPINLTDNPSITPKINQKAISICIYKSDRFNYEKHIVPLNRFLKGVTCNDYDILIFYKDENDLSHITLNSSNHNVRLFKVTSNETNFECHLWRYLGAYEPYDWIWFRGSDTVEIPPRERKLENCATLMNCDIIMWSSETYDCTGRVAITGTLRSELTKHLRSFNPDLEKFKNIWNCDEVMLSEWTLNNNFRTLLAMDKSTITLPWMEDRINRRLRSGNHTVVIKDRDDSSNLSKNL